MNLLSPTIFPDNTEVNGKMKMKCLNINGDNINEIVTGPKIIYRSGKRSFLKSISIDGYRVTVSYIDELFQGATVEAVFRRNNLNAIYVRLYPNGNVDINGTSYNSVNTSWKTISFNISTDIQDGYISIGPEGTPTGIGPEGTHTELVTFDFILPSSSEHTLYSSFISDMKYMSENVEVIKIIDGKGKNDTDLLGVANDNKPCLIISNSPGSVTLVLNNSTTQTPVFYRITSSVNIPITTPITKSQRFTSFNDSTVNESIKALKDRINELEYKLRKFGIE